jgi:hypothetical protein
MKLLEKLIYSGVLFLVVYVVVSLTLRLFEFTTVYVSHMIGGIGATVVGVLLFMYLLLKK